MTNFISSSEWEFKAKIRNGHSIWYHTIAEEFAIADDSGIDRWGEHRGPDHTEDGILYIDRSKSRKIYAENNGNNQIIIPIGRNAKWRDAYIYKWEETESICSWHEALEIMRLCEMDIQIILKNKIAPDIVKHLRIFNSWDAKLCDSLMASNKRKNMNHLKEIKKENDQLVQ